VTYFRIDDRPQTEMLPGIKRSAVWMDRTMLTFFRFEPGSVVPEHAHENEQITLVTEGRMEFTLNDEVRLLCPGEGACIPPNTPHSARILDEPTVAIDAWSPPRQDYMA
jgi:quercetin dioxygenase-like cupin family protein